MIKYKNHSNNVFPLKDWRGKMKEENFVFKESYYYVMIVVFSLLLIFVLIPSGIQKGDPRLFPYIYSISLFILAIFKLLSIFTKKERTNYQFHKATFMYVGLSILAYFIYSVTVQHVGFFVMSFIFILVIVRFLGESWRLSIILSVALPGSIYFIFTKLLSLYFPSGILF